MAGNLFHTGPEWAGIGTLFTASVSGALMTAVVAGCLPCLTRVVAHLAAPRQAPAIPGAGAAVWGLASGAGAADLFVKHPLVWINDEFDVLHYRPQRQRRRFDVGRGERPVEEHDTHLLMVAVPVGPGLLEVVPALGAGYHALGV